MRWLRLIVLAGWGAAAACSANGAGSVTESDLGVSSEVALDQEFQLQVGERAVVPPGGTQPGGLTITFLRVTQDSRCPSDVTCVWSGDAEVVLELVTRESGSQTVTVHTHVEPRTATAVGYAVRLVDLDPYPRSETPIAPSSYVATLIVSRP